LQENVTVYEKMRHLAKKDMPFSVPFTSAIYAGNFDIFAAKR
jgi:hypothetical protein